MSRQINGEADYRNYLIEIEQQHKNIWMLSYIWKKLNK
jgi:hypothetical protein